MRLVTASLIHSGKGWMPAGTTLALDATGKITDILPNAPQGTIYYEGILCPGFVNTHCHLELSHLKGQIPKHTGLIPFLQQVPTTRNNYSEVEKQVARAAAYKSMLAAGVVAVGDIANTTDTVDIRQTGLMHVHSLVESIGFNPMFADRSLAYAQQVKGEFATNKSSGKKLLQTIVPHAPYSVSQRLMELINEVEAQQVFCIHNQESEEESRYYKDKSGQVSALLQSLNIDESGFVATGKNSIQSYLQWIDDNRHCIFVHNTYTTAEDVQYVASKTQKAFWCLCPNANLYIENKLPDVAMFMKEQQQICIGTDSLASNYSLSVLDELQTIKRHYPEIEWETLLCWATSNGATALKLDDVVGTLSIGTAPGILHLMHMDQSVADAVTVNRIA